MCRLAWNIGHRIQAYTLSQNQVKYNSHEYGYVALFPQTQSRFCHTQQNRIEAQSSQQFQTEL